MLKDGCKDRGLWLCQHLLAAVLGIDLPDDAKNNMKHRAMRHGKC